MRGGIVLIFLVVGPFFIKRIILNESIKTIDEQTITQNSCMPILNTALTDFGNNSESALSCPHDVSPVARLCGAGCLSSWRIGFALRGKRRHRCNAKLDSYVRRLPCHVDIFWHHWSLTPDEENWLVNRYKPKAWVFEDPSILRPIIDLFEVVDGAPRQASNHAPMFRGISRSLQLVREYEEKHGFRYDMVISVRWDIAQDHIGPMVLPWVCPNVTRLYSLFGPELNWAFYDQWFYFNSDNMHRISSLYDDFWHGYLYPRKDQNGNNYTKMIENGLIESDATNYWSCTTLDDEATGAEMDMAAYRPHIFAIRHVHLVLKYYLDRLGLWGTHIHCYCVDRDYEDWFASSMARNVYGLRPWSNVPPRVSPNCIASDSYPVDVNRRTTEEFPQV